MQTWRRREAPGAAADDTPAVAPRIFEHMTAIATHDPLHEALDLALAFAGEHYGRIAGYDARALAAALGELAAVEDAVAAAAPVAALRPDGPERLARAQAVTLCFDCEWAAMPAARAQELLADPRLADFSHFLRVARRSAPGVEAASADDGRVAG